MSDESAALLAAPNSLPQVPMFPILAETNEKWGSSLTPSPLSFNQIGRPMTSALVIRHYSAFGSAGAGSSTLGCSVTGAAGSAGAASSVFSGVAGGVVGAPAGAVMCGGMVGGSLVGAGLEAFSQPTANRLRISATEVFFILNLLSLELVLYLSRQRVCPSAL